MLASTVATLAAVLAVLLLRPVAEPPEMRVELSVPETADPAAMAIAPDGTKVVFVAGEAAQRQLWVRFLNNMTPRPVPGTEGAASPFWFPDGRTIGFTADTGMKRADIASGSVRPLQSRGGDAVVNAAGVILIEGGTGPIRRIDPGATEAVAATRVEPFSAGHRAPHFLPDGRRFLFYSSGSRAIYLGDLDTLDSTRLMDADSGAAYAASGHLLFVRQGTLFAHAFDPARLELRGEPMEIARQVGVGLMGRPAVSASAAGPIVYRTTTAEARSQFAWFNRSGAELQTIGEPLSSVRSFSTSPDGLHVSLQMAVGGNNDIWLLETSRGVLNRLTSDPGLEGSAIWSPDGTRIVYQTDRGGTRAMVARSASGIGGEEVLLSSPDTKLTRDWSPDGSHILYLSGGPSGADLWALPLAGKREPFPVANTSFDEVGGQFSPDGKWIAYSSNELGRFEIYVQPFPGNGPKTRISTNGGAQVRWSRDGRELFYIGLDERLMSVAIRLDSSKGAVEHIGPPAPLFMTRVGGAVQQGGFPTQYAVSADGQRFLMKTVRNGLTTSPLTLILNWKPDR